MILIYNLLQFILSPFIFILLVVGLYKEKNRKKIPQRLGRNLPQREIHKKTLWIHALSVGEINSSLPLVRALRENFSAYRIVVSASTVAGKKRAEEILSLYADHIVGAPFDFLPVVAYYIYRINPSIYIQVETDFWPNILYGLSYKRVPRMLVNGRISKKSMRLYRRFSFFFQPLFTAYNTLSMQTQTDVIALQKLGIPTSTTDNLGNLKFAQQITTPKMTIPAFYANMCKGKKVIVAGSTHPGEEDILCASFAQLKKDIPQILFFIAPRNIERSKEIERIAQKYGLTTSCRSHQKKEQSDLYVIDTIGELMQFYALADLCFVGGSLVDFGGHNPIEPASLAKAIIFGPHMGSFTEIVPLFTKANAAQQVDTKDLNDSLRTLILNDELMGKMATAAQQLIQNQQQGILKAHIAKIHDLLSNKIH